MERAQNSRIRVCSLAVSTDPESNSKGGSWQNALHESSPFLGLGIQLAGTMLFYVFVGYMLDRWLNTSPWLLIAGSVVGMIAFFFQIYRLSVRLSEPKTGKKMHDMDKT